MTTPDERFAVALQRLDGDRDLFCELATYFIEDSPGLLEAARTGLAAQNADATCRAMHALRGLIATFDADRAISIAKSVEVSAACEDWPPISELLTRLDTEVAELRSELLEYGVSGTSRKLN